MHQHMKIHCQPAKKVQKLSLTVRVRLVILISVIVMGNKPNYEKTHSLLRNDHFLISTCLFAPCRQSTLEI